MHMTDDRSAKTKEILAFDCAMCGHCCEGRGGIVVSKKDLDRLCSFLDLDAKEFEKTLGERHANKLHVRVGDNGTCIFFGSL